MRIPRGRSLWSERLAGVPSSSTQAGILDELRQVILDGDAPPGTSIPVDDVADLFGVSRIPVREALKTLIGEGLVSQRPHSGYAVAQLTRAELQEFYTVRGVLELALLSTALNQAQPDDDALVRKAHSALKIAVGGHDARGHHRESRRFHFALLAPSGMDRMLRMLESAWNMTEPAQPMAYVSHSHEAALTADHQQMLEAFLARDASGLNAAAAVHNENLADIVISLPHDAGLFVDD